MKKIGLFVVGLLLMAVVVTKVNNVRLHSEGYREVPGYSQVYKKVVNNDLAFERVEYVTPSGMKLNYDVNDVELMETLNEIFD